MERHVSFVRESSFDGETFTSLAHARESRALGCRETAGMRVHGKTRKVPREVLESIERPTMLPAPETIYDAPLYVEKAKVHPDHHIQVARALYSVPTLYLRKHVRVRADRSLVKIYFGHRADQDARARTAGRTRDGPRGLPVWKEIYARAMSTRCSIKAKERGLHVGVCAERLLGGGLRLVVWLDPSGLSDLPNGLNYLRAPPGASPPIRCWAGAHCRAQWAIARAHHGLATLLANA